MIEEKISFYIHQLTEKLHYTQEAPNVIYNGGDKRNI